MEPRRLLAADLAISEFVASNANGPLDEDRQSSDWIELHNPGELPTDLSDYYLSDDPAELKKWQLPAQTLAPGAFLLVFASGNDRQPSDGEAHTNFRLDVDGEYLALVHVNESGPRIIQQFAPAYPRQFTDVSYGFAEAAAGQERPLRYFTTPTPDAENGTDGQVGFVRDTAFSADRGFYQAPGPGEPPLAVEITTPTDNATIVYTRDGSAPRADTSTGRVEVLNGTVYTTPVVIEGTTPLRAAAFKADYVPTNVDTQTYVFLEDVMRQNGDGLSESWGTFPSSSSIGGTPWRIGQAVPADWEMDQTIVSDPAYRDDMIDNLKSVPSVSLSMEPDDLFGDQGIYVNPLRRGDRWERPVSIEYFDANSNTDFQVNAGIRIHGGASRRPDQTRKHSLRLKFRETYDGNSKLNFPLFKDAPFGESAAETFDTLILRGSYSDGFSVGDLSWSPINLRDQWARDTQLALGQPSPHGKYLHVYINGIYWGLYNATERIEGSFVEAYLGGDQDHADVITDDGLNEGTTRQWNEALALARQGLASSANYAAVQELVDVENLIDYMLVQTHSGNWDWPQNNWLTVRKQGPDGRFHFPVWDVEVGLGAARNTSGHDLRRNQTRVNKAGTPAQLYAALRANEEFRLLFADHIQRHFFHDGPLSPGRAAELFQARVDEVFQAIVPETARWGDHNGIRGGTRNLPYTRDGEWQSEIDWILNNWFPQRTQIVLDQFRSIRLYPDTEPAVFQINGGNRHGGTVAAGDVLTLTSPAGTIWYTLDGRDPRLPATVDLADTRLISANSSVRVLVPSLENGGDLLNDQWHGGAEPFDDSADAGWSVAQGGVGFERGGTGDYSNRIGIDVEQEMDGINTSVYVRIPFTVQPEDRDQIASLQLRMQYDDGFVAYLNGVEVARANFDDPMPAWNSAASGAHETLNFQDFDISPYADLIRAGDNLLAIHGLNRSTANGDMLILAELMAGGDEGTAGVSPSALAFDGTPIPLTESTQVKARVLAAGQWSALSDATFLVNPPAERTVVISEINYNPYDPTPEERNSRPALDNDSFEFLEIVNAHASESVNLGEFTLSQAVDFTFPLVSLEPGQRAVVVRDVEAFQLRYGASVEVVGEWSGALANNGERIVFSDGSGQVLMDVDYDDSDPWPQRADGAGATVELLDPMNTTKRALGKYFSWRGSTGFGGSPGDEGPPPLGVVINEVLARTNPPAMDSIELANRTGQPIDVGGWFLSDSDNDFLKFRIPPGTILEAGQYVVFDESDFNPAPDIRGDRGFALSGARGDDVWLTIPNASGGVASFVDDVHFRASAVGESFGRFPDGEGRLAPMSKRTFGAGNSSPRVGPVIITELNYHPTTPSDAALSIHAGLRADDLEFIEIHNPTRSPVDLAGWRLRGGVDYEFSPGTVLPAGALGLIISFDPDDRLNASRLTAFQAHYRIDDTVELLGAYAGQLRDDGERIQLQRAEQAPLMPDVTPRLWEDELLYDDLLPWPVAADGGGLSLARRSRTAFGNDPASWHALTPTPGSVGFAMGDFNADGRVNVEDVALLSSGIRAADMAFDLDGNGAVEHADLVFLIRVLLSTRFGDANLDGVFDSGDLVQVFRVGEYEDGIVANSSWGDGDWDADGEFDSGDLVVAFQDGGYTSGAERRRL